MGLTRENAIKQIETIIDKNLVELASKYDINIFNNGKKNKGWVGHTIERHLGLPINSSQAPNFGSWELKTCSLKYLQNQSLSIKETIAVTMIDPYNLEKTVFEDSHLLSKLKKMLLVARIWYSKDEKKSEIYGCYSFDLNNEEYYQQIKTDYELIRNIVIENGFSALSGKFGKYIQARTKGKGHGSTSRAFYIKTNFLKKIIDI